MLHDELEVSAFTVLITRINSSQCVYCVTNAMEQRHFENIPVAELLYNLPTFYETQWIIIVFTSARHWSIS
jgi:hypothetical protein